MVPWTSPSGTLFNAMYLPRCDFSGSSYFAGFFGVFHNRRRFYYLFFNYLFLTI